MSIAYTFLDRLHQLLDRYRLESSWRCRSRPPDAVPARLGDQDRQPGVRAASGSKPVAAPQNYTRWTQLSSAEADVVNSCGAGGMRIATLHSGERRDSHTGEASTPNSEAWGFMAGEGFKMTEILVTTATILRDWRLVHKLPIRVRELLWATVQPRGVSSISPSGWALSRFRNLSFPRRGLCSTSAVYRSTADRWLSSRQNLSHSWAAAAPGRERVRCGCVRLEQAIRSLRAAGRLDPAVLIPHFQHTENPAEMHRFSSLQAPSSQSPVEPLMMLTLGAGGCRGNSGFR